jgi:hypothetical protein
MVLKCTVNSKIKSLVLLLILLLMALLLTPILAAEDEEEELRIIIQGIPESPVAGSTWTLTLLVDHHDPNEVDVLAPPFTGPFTLEQVNKGPRIMDTTEVWIGVEYRYKANIPESFSFDAFTVITPDVQIKVYVPEVTVQKSPTASQATVVKQMYRFVWEGLPSNLAIGESAVFNLRISGWDSSPLQSDVLLVPARLFIPPVPPGHILESLPLSSEERSAGMAVKLRLVPLEAIPLIIEGRNFSHNTANGKYLTFEIPYLRITVSQAQKSPVAVPEVNKTAQNKKTAAPFPSIETAAAEYPSIFIKHKIECEAVYTDAKNLWENARFAEALATIRKNERDHSAGKLFTVIRRSAEQALGLSGTHDERRDIIMRLWLLIGRYRSAVLKETSIRRIPDQAGGEIAILKEGQPVLVLQHGTKNNKWLQVITGDNNKTTGWVPEEKIIFY